MFNKLCRIGNEPEVRYLQNGDAVMNLSLAYQYGRKGDDGKKPTQWIDATLWGKQAEALQKYLRKGDQISVSIDDLHIESFEGKKGTMSKLSGKIVALDFVAKAKNGNDKEEIQAVKKVTKFDDIDNDIPF